MQFEILDEMKKGRQLCSKQVAEMFGITRQCAANKLHQLEKHVDKVGFTYKQEKAGVIITSVKYYYFKP